MLKPKVNKMVQKLGSTTTGRFKDTDKDGVPNIIDCKPYNPNQQGIIHTIGAKIARKAGSEKIAGRIEAAGERSEERAAYREEERRVASRAATIERKKQVVQTATYKEKIAGEKKRKFIQKGGWGGAISRGAEKIGKAAPKGKGKYKPFDLSNTQQLFPKQKKPKGLPKISEFKMKF